MHLMVIPFNLALTNYGECGCSDLSDNQLIGDIPASIGKSPKLRNAVGQLGLVV